MLFKSEVTRTGVRGRVGVRLYLTLGRLLGRVGDELVLPRSRVQNNLTQRMLVFSGQLGLNVYLALLGETVFVDVGVGRLV